MKNKFFQNTEPVNGNSRNDHQARTVLADQADVESSFDPIRDDFMTIRVPRQQHISDDFIIDKDNPEVLKTFAAPIANANNELEVVSDSSRAGYLKIRMQKQMKKKMHNRLHDFSELAADR